MTTSADSALHSLFKSISPSCSEADIEHKVVIPLLHALAYNDADWQTQVTIGKAKLDFLIKPQDLPLLYLPYLVIEVKAPNKKIAQSVWQISEYMRESGAIFGLLTNGYSFRILYNFDGKIATITEYNWPSLISQFKLFYGLLSKTTCLIIGAAINKANKQVHVKFLGLISKVFDIDIFELSKRVPKAKDPVDSNKNNSQAEGTSLDNDSSKERKSMIVTIFNNKGGVGKTTTTINLAAALNKLGKRILLIDIDAQANLTMGLGIDPLNDLELQSKKDISHLLTEPKTTLEHTVIRKHWDDVQLDIIPSHIRLSEMEATLIMTPDIDRVLAKKLKKYHHEYDYVLIDPPPSFGKANTISLMASSAVLIPTQLAPYPIRALEYVINRAIAVDQSRDEPLPILGVAVSMYNRAANKVALSMTEQILEILSKNPESKSVELWPQETWIPSLSIITTTPDKGYPLSFAEFDRDLNAREKEAAQDAFSCYMKLAEYLISATKGVEK